MQYKHSLRWTLPRPLLSASSHTFEWTLQSLLPCKHPHSATATAPPSTLPLPPVYSTKIRKNLLEYIKAKMSKIKYVHVYTVWWEFYIHTLPDYIHRTSTRLKEVSTVFNLLYISQNTLPHHLDNKAINTLIIYHLLPSTHIIFQNVEK